MFMLFMPYHIVTFLEINMGSWLRNSMAEKDEWPKWQIALAVGATVAAGAAAVWYFTKKHKPSTDENDKTENGAAAKESALPEKEQKDPLSKARDLKNKGNKFFKGGKYDKAVQHYTEAIQICPDKCKEDIATFYQNRAAAYEHLKNYDQVIGDCSKALEYNSKYVKALSRRAKASEQTGDLMLSLEDITAVCILEQFQNQHSLVMADRVLKELGKSKAKDAYLHRQPVEPSPQFIRTYFSAFTKDPIMSTIEKAEGNGEIESSVPEKHQDETPEKEQIDDKPLDLDGQIKKYGSPYKAALMCLKRQQYRQIVTLCSREINTSDSAHPVEALLLRATFYLLRGEGNKAMDDIDRLLEKSNVDKRIRSNALIKRGSLKMQNGQQAEALEDFGTAVKEDPENSDIYHHRGQLHLLIDKVDDAVADFERSVTLSPEFAIAHVQKCYTDYRQALVRQSPLEVQKALKSFEDNIDKFENCAEGYALYGQALCDQQQFEKAEENFKKALELEPDNGNIYVHRGLLRLQWKQDIYEAARLIKEGLTVDDKCEFAYETLGTIEVQRGNLDIAMELFNKAISLAKTEVEMGHLYSLLDAAIAQSRAAQRFGINHP